MYNVNSFLFFKKNNFLKTNYLINKSSEKTNMKSIFLTNYFNKYNLFKLGNLNKNVDMVFLFKFNRNYYYNFNIYLNNKNYINFFLVINRYFKSNFNFLILDSSYKNTLPLYNYIFGNKNLYHEKLFFFLNKKNIINSS